MADYGAWEGLGQALGTGADAFSRAKQAKAQAMRQSEQDALDAELKNAQIGKLKSEADLLAGGGYSLGQLLGLPPSDPRYKIPVNPKQAPTVVAQGVGMGGVPEAASTKAAEASSILSGASNLGKLAQEAAEESKSGVSSLPIVQDILPGMQSKFPASTKSVSPKLSAYLTQSQSVLDAIGRERSGGAITGDEWLSFRQFLPQPHDYKAGPDAVRMKLDQLANEYAQKLAQKADTIKNPVEREKWRAEKLASVDVFKQDLYKSFLPQGQPSAGQGAELDLGGGFKARRK